MHTMTNYSSSPSLFFLLLLLLVVSSFPFLAFSYNCHDTDRNALLSIKSSMGDPYVIITWGQSYNCCDWNGVECDTSGRVTEVDIFADTVNGTISPSIGDLKYLTSLTFHKLVNLTGPIPPAIAKLTKLTFLRLDWNDLSGPVPAFLGELTSLDYLNLGFNHFTGSIPPVLGKLPLSFIRIDRNQLTGSIPDSLGQSPSQYLYLSHNNLTGTIPNSFSKSNYQVIDVSRNRLTGDASPLFAISAPTYFNLDLSRNLFEFNLTEVKLPKGIVALDLNHNKIYGEIPKEFGEKEWQSFNVSYNRLCGQIPSGDRLNSLSKYEFFHNECLCGTPLPPCAVISEM